jgi:hypothetical protein
MPCVPDRQQHRLGIRAQGGGRGRASSSSAPGLLIDLSLCYNIYTANILWVWLSSMVRWSIQCIILGWPGRERV